MSLTIDQLFTPEQSGVGLDPNVPAADGTWLAFLLSAAQIVGLSTTSWQPGAPERTILAVAAVAFAQEDVVISMMAQGGFLDFAASGTVTTVAIDGTSVTKPVTPDPSIASENPTGAPGWLDALGQSFFKVTRLQATYASGTLAIANTGITTLNYVAGNYHAANASTGATYANVDALAVPPSAIAGTGGVVTGVVLGSGTATVTTQSAHGLSPNQTIYIIGTAGFTGLNGTFATITAVLSATSFRIAATATGTWSSGGTVYLCTTATMKADVVGIASNAAAGKVTATVTQNAGTFVSNLTSWSASNFESNLNYAARCRLKLGALSPNGPASAYDYIALTASYLLAALEPPVTLRNGSIAKATTFSNPQTEVVTVLVSSSTPASAVLGEPVTPGCAQLLVSDASNTSPIEITTIADHGLLTGDAAIVAGVLGNTAANQAATITVTGTAAFTLDGSTGNGTYSGGGTVEGGDLGQIDQLIQTNVVPDGQTGKTQSSLAFPVTVVATVIVPQAYLATYQAAAPVALQALLASLPIGGNIPPGESAGTIPYSAVEGALVDAGVLTVGAVSYVRSVTNLTVNGDVIDVAYPTPDYDALLATPVLSVIGV